MPISYVLGCVLPPNVAFDGELNDEELIDARIKKREELTLGMANHVRQCQTQRNELIKRYKHAQKQLMENVAWPDRDDIFVGDFSQNADIPKFGMEQVGDTYYYSPLSIFIFGAVNYATKKLHAFVYPEYEGKKGGNNVSSLFWKTFQIEGILELAHRKGPGKSLTLVFDNCSGQNKNRMVLRFALFLVESNIYKKVEVLFLITGHTKNVCDKMFNDLKHGYHYQNIYCFDDLINIFDEHDDVHVHKVNYIAG